MALFFLLQALPETAAEKSVPDVQSPLSQLHWPVPSYIIK